MRRKSSPLSVLRSKTRGDINDALSVNQGIFITMNKDIVFTYVTDSTGHKSVANSVCKALKEIEPEISTHCIDSTYSYPIISPILSQFYLEMISKTPQIWDFVWDNADVKKATTEIRNLFNIINIPKVNKLLKMYNPGAFVSTHSLPANILAFKKKHDKLNKPLMAIITDYCIHSYWINREIDLYMVANGEIYNKLLTNGIPETKIKITGIPVDPIFLDPVNRKQSRKYFNMEQKLFTVMIMGGSKGLLPLYETLNRLSQINLPIQYLVIVGNNKKLFHELKKEFSGNKKFQILGYIKSINIAMDASDLLITKAGGVTIAESLTKNLPMIVLEPLPGQEKANTQYLLKNRIAEKCESVDELSKLIYDYYSQPQRLAYYRNKMMNFAKPYAAYNCARLIAERFRNNNSQQ